MLLGNKPHPWGPSYAWGRIVTSPAATSYGPSYPQIQPVSPAVDEPGRSRDLLDSKIAFVYHGRWLLVRVRAVQRAVLRDNLDGCRAALFLSVSRFRVCRIAWVTWPAESPSLAPAGPVNGEPEGRRMRGRGGSGQEVARRGVGHGLVSCPHSRMGWATASVRGLARLVQRTPFGISMFEPNQTPLYTISLVHQSPPADRLAASFIFLVPNDTEGGLRRTRQASGSICCVNRVSWC